MGRYFGREPRYTRDEIETQAKQAIEAQVSLGRPPDDDWRPLDARLAELDLDVASRPQPQVVTPSRPVPAPVGATTPPA